ncbi:MAG: hypothetical protein LBN96_09240 [Desulfovibrio sp.]|jgi:hypothetical protein|nr:hypothetical protein [Desulfovibrio sp.]
MSRFAVFVFALLLAAIQGCNGLGIRNPFHGDPLTGGSEAAASGLLDIPLPSGMKRYPSHGYQTYGAHGGREGLESLRGNIDLSGAIQSLHASLVRQGWQLRISLRKGDRAVQIYERGNVSALLNFRRQTVMTILEIWVGGRLPDGSMPNLADGHDGQAAPEGGSESLTPVPGTVEQWGGGEPSAPPLQERAL